MKLSVFVLAIVVCASVLEAARIVKVNRAADDRDNVRSRRGFWTRLAGYGRRVMGNTLDTLRQDLGLPDNVGLRYANSQPVHSAHGGTRYRIWQTLGGLDIIGCSLETEMLHGALTGQMYGSMADHLATDIPNPNACMQDVDTMINQAIWLEGHYTNDPYISERHGRRIVWLDPATHTASLAYQVEFLYLSANTISRPVYYIQACGRNDVIVKYDQVMNATTHQLSRIRRQATEECVTDPTTTSRPTNPTANPPTRPTQTPTGQCSNTAVGRGGNAKVGEYQYGVFPRCLNLTVSGDTCTMQNDYGKVVDMEQTKSTSRSTAVQFRCTQGYADAVNEAYGVANDALYFGTITGLLYQNKYDFKALSWVPKLGVHYDRDYENAFWTGRDMYFGDGRNYFYPLVNQDVVAHELGHGITTENSNLVYSGESGGINEAFSDMSGEAAEMFGSGSNDWKVGFQLRKDANGALRYFIDPTDDGRSIKHVRDFTANMDVHHSSGVYNHAFYQMVQVNGMDIFDAYNCFLTANRLLWNANTNFADGACNVMQAAYDLGLSHTIVKASFNVVGIDLSGCAYTALAPRMATGDKRNGITTSRSVKPIFEANATSGTVTSSCDNGSLVTIDVCADPSCFTIIQTGTCEVTYASDANAYFRLSTTSAMYSRVNIRFY